VTVRSEPVPIPELVVEIAACRPSLSWNDRRLWNAGDISSH
jgi:hypothetical protein